MKIVIQDNHAYVTLSARNLQHLQRMLENGAGFSLSRRDGAHSINVSVESDEVHYANREAGPGYPEYNPPRTS